MAIPRMIHLMWTTKECDRDGDPLPAEVADRVALFRRMLPDAQVVCWSWADVEDLLDDTEGQRILKAARSCTLTAMRVDLLRLAIVHRVGGIWSDMKNRPLCDFTRHLPAEGPVLCEHFPTPAQPDPMGKLCNSFFAARPGDAFLELALTTALQTVEARQAGSVFDLTGGGLFNRLRRGWTGPELQVLPLRPVWTQWLRRTQMGYNAGDLHWSVRQKTEPLYL